MIYEQYEFDIGEEFYFNGKTLTIIGHEDPLSIFSYLQECYIIEPLYLVREMPSNITYILKQGTLLAGEEMPNLKRIVAGVGYLGEAQQKSPQTVYRVWKDMIHRCYNPANNLYKYYGESGITVCERWKCYEYFLFDLLEDENFEALKSSPMNRHKYELFLFDDEDFPMYKPYTCCISPFGKTDVGSNWKKLMGEDQKFLSSDELVSLHTFLDKDFDTHPIIKPGATLINKKIQPIVSPLDPNFKSVMDEFIRTEGKEYISSNFGMKTMCTIVDPNKKP